MRSAISLSLLPNLLAAELWDKLKSEGKRSLAFLETIYDGK
ncbi:MAG TPA: hypothetical protein PLP33_27525 [Leptospiraceae bacterium]|nr:hypothetical protein [Leptospiraceae bacterium]